MSIPITSCKVRFRSVHLGSLFDLFVCAVCSKKLSRSIHRFGTLIQGVKSDANHPIFKPDANHPIFKPDANHPIFYEIMEIVFQDLQESAKEETIGLSTSKTCALSLF